MAAKGKHALKSLHNSRKERKRDFFILLSDADICYVHGTDTQTFMLGCCFHLAMIKEKHFNLQKTKHLHKALHFSSLIVSSSFMYSLNH